MSLLRLWRVLGRRRRDDAILREELSAHLQALDEQYRAEGCRRRLRAPRRAGSLAT